ncbi:flagellar biosynthesis protein FlaG [Bacillus methanolicus]|uniref:flagellar protein FlaG n=1 Tax=Bacillus methanolicus TaxID=1471 RepID=UPI0023800735|nr:flagellar protein FlaG [Bacillus methanolicus]MDE3840139.1 flagellar biosynthesis protein FlaG [Bacillus methanolicus]
MIERISSQGVSYSARTSSFEKSDTQLQTKLVNTVQDEQSLNKNLDQNKDEVEKIVKGLNEFLQPSQTSIKFELHEKLNEYYVTVVDDRTHEVIKEIPSKKLLDIYAAMTEFLGLVVDKKI